MTKKSSLLYFGLISIISVFLFLLLTHPTSFQKSFEMKSLTEIKPGAFKLPEELYSTNTVILIKSPGDNQALCQFEKVGFIHAEILIPESCRSELFRQNYSQLKIQIQGRAEFYRLLIGK